MIPFDFAYYRPDTLDEAVQVFQKLQADGKSATYLAGGTEIITLGRVNKLQADAVIDIKAIPECTAMQVTDGKLVIGAAVSIVQAEEANMFPLLTVAAGRIADHTSRCKITVGGNLCGSFTYREAVLALLVAESDVVIASPEGVRTVPIMNVFNRQMQLQRGELLVQIVTDAETVKLPHKARKKMRQDYIGYPLVSAASLQKDGRVRMAFAGLCEGGPFRSAELEQQMNQQGAPLQERIDGALQSLPSTVVSDVEGSAEYRLVVFKKLLQEIMSAYEEV